MHGLSAKTNQTSTDLAQQSVEISDRGVFPARYRQQVNAALPKGTRLDIRTLLAYVSEVTHQYDTAQLGPRATIPQCMARLVAHQPNDQGWWTIAVPYIYDFSSLPEPNRTSFENEFEEVEIEPRVVREHFGLLGHNRDVYRFYQSKKVMSWSAGFQKTIPIGSLFGATEGFIEPRYVEDGYDFVLSRPFPHAAGPFRMTEPLATYLVMFYLGSLVRYLPDDFDDLLETRSAWIIESFVTSSPLSMRRAFVSKITDRVYVFNK
jgi:hypothetical protein